MRRKERATCVYRKEKSLNLVGRVWSWQEAARTVERFDVLSKVALCFLSRSL